MDTKWKEMQYELIELKKILKKKMHLSQKLRINLQIPMQNRFQ